MNDYDNQPANCPVCVGQALKPITVSGIKLDRCPRCQGTWFDAKEFEALVHVAMKDVHLVSGSQVTRRVCPRDGQPLTALTYPQTMVEVDRCPSCHGLWLDKGEAQEINKVRSYLRRAGQLEQYAEVPGVKGSIIRKLNDWIDRLSHYDD